MTVPKQKAYIVLLSIEYPDSSTQNYLDLIVADNEHKAIDFATHICMNEYGHFSIVDCKWNELSQNAIDQIKLRC
jgi:hypothetical protein